MDFQGALETLVGVNWYLDFIVLLPFSALSLYAAIEGRFPAWFGGRINAVLFLFGAWKIFVLCALLPYMLVIIPASGAILFIFVRPDTVWNRIAYFIYSILAVLYSGVLLLMIGTAGP